MKTRRPQGEMSTKYNFLVFVKTFVIFVLNRISHWIIMLQIRAEIIT